MACAAPSAGKWGGAAWGGKERGMAMGFLLLPDRGRERWNVVQAVTDRVHINLAEGRLVRTLRPQSLEDRAGGSVAGIFSARREPRRF